MTEAINKFTHLKVLSSEPLPLETERKLKFPVASTGKYLSKAIPAFATRNNLDELLVANTLLAALNAFTQGYANLHIGARWMPLILYFCSIAPSGSRKSAIFSAALQEFIRKETVRRKQRKEKIRDYEARKAWFDKEAKKLLSTTENKDEYLSQISALGEEPLKPADVTMHIKNATVEGIKRKFKEGSTVLAWHTDEAGSFISGYAMNPENLDATSSFLNDMWSTGSCDKNIGAEESAKYCNRRLSIHIMPQPRLSRKFISNGALDDNGLLGRFLIVHSTYGEVGGDEMSNVEEEDHYSQEEAEFPQEFKDFLDRSYEVVSWELPLDVELPYELRPPKLRLTDEAFQLYKRFEKEMLRNIHSNNDYSFIAGLTLKAHDHAARLASCLFIFDEVNSLELPAGFPKVTEQYMRYGIDLMRFYLEQAIELVLSGPRTLIDDKAKSAHERWLKEVCPKKKRNILFMNEFQTEVCKSRSVTVARNIAETLIRLGHVSKVGPCEIDGVHRQEVYELKTKNA